MFSRVKQAVFALQPYPPQQELPICETRKDALRVDFDRLIKLECHGSTISGDGDLLAYRQLDEAFGLTLMADDVLADIRRPSNVQHGLTALRDQSIYRSVSRLR